MLDKFTYINHLGEIINFGENNIIIDSNGLRDFTWSYNNYYGKASGFKKKMYSLPLTIMIYGDNVKSTADHLFEVLEKDVIDGQRGTIYINDYYIKAFFYASKKEKYLVDGILKLKYNIVVDSPYWIRETSFQIRPNDSTTNTWLNYPHVFPFNYGKDVISTTKVVNDSFIPQNVKITIFGACANPSVIINGHTYAVNCTLASDEKLVINTSEKTVKKYNSAGVETNMFKYRSTLSYIFEKIPVGVLTVLTTPSGTNAEIAILEERSEPKWMTGEEVQKTELEEQLAGASITAEFNDEKLYIVITDIDSIDFALENEHLIVYYDE